MQLLAAVDPANPWGALLPWPATADKDARLRRVPGAWLVVIAGKPVLYVAPNGRRLHTFPAMIAAEQELRLAFEALHRLPRRRTLIVEEIDGQPVRESPHAEHLRSSGFVDDYRGLAAEIGYSNRA